MHCNIGFYRKVNKHKKNVADLQRKQKTASHTKNFVYIEYILGFGVGLVHITLDRVVLMGGVVLR